MNRPSAARNGSPVAGFVVALIITLVVAPLVDSRIATAEEWTSVDTGRTIQGAFLGMWEDSVVLRLTDGRRVVVEKAKLNASSRLQADDLIAAKLDKRKQRLAELQRGSQGVSTSNVQPAAVYNPIPEQLSLPEFVQHVAKEVEAGHLRALWDALPENYQQDVGELVGGGAKVIPEQDFLVIQRVLGQLGRTLAKQREFAFNYHLMSKVPDEQLGTTKSVYTALAGIVAAIGDAKTVDLESLKQGNISEIIDRLDLQLAPHVAAMVRMDTEGTGMLPQLTKLTPGNISMEGPDKGTITITGPMGEPSPQMFMRTEGMWLPEDMVAQWPEMMQSAREQLAKAAENPPQAGAAGLAFGMVGAALGNIENAETQEEFDETIDMYVQTLVALIEPQLNQIGAGMASGMNNNGMGAGNPMNSGGYPGSQMGSGGMEMMGSGSSMGSGSPMGPGSSAHGGSGPESSAHGGS